VRWRLPAKVNWDLRVLGRRPDGFHELRSWFLAVDWCDRLLAAPSVLASFSVAGPEARSVPADATNLVLRAEAAWRAAGGEAPPVAWRLEKHVPPASGLGGGSSDGAGVLVALQSLAVRPVPAAELRELAAGLGSDLPFFLEEGEGAQLRGGRGERLLRRAPLPAPWLVLAVPPVEIATARVYASLAAPPLEGQDESAVAEAPARQPGPNDLEPPARQLWPALDRALDLLESHAPFRMSGSGGAVFAPCADEAGAEALAARVQAAVGPGWRIRACRVLASGRPRPEEPSWP